VDLIATTEKQHVESEKQHVYHMLQSVGLPSGKVIKTLYLLQNSFHYFASEYCIDKLNACNF
jgi:hypothetical protein